MIQAGLPMHRQGISRCFSILLKLQAALTNYSTYIQI